MVLKAVRFCSNLIILTDPPAFGYGSGMRANDLDEVTFERAKGLFLNDGVENMKIRTPKDLASMAGITAAQARKVIASCAGMKRSRKPTLFKHPMSVYEKHTNALASTHAKNLNIIEKQMEKARAEVEAYDAMGEAAPSNVTTTFMRLKAEWERLSGVGAIIDAANKRLSSVHSGKAVDVTPPGQKRLIDGGRGKIIDAHIFKK